MIKYLFLFFSLLILLHNSCSQDCNQQLIDDNVKITASSMMAMDRGPERARLYDGGAWTAKSSDFSQYLTINLNGMKNITGIATQGRAYTSEYVQEYSIDFGNQGIDFIDYKDIEGYPKLFQGNVDGESVKYNYFETPIIAQYIRINPTRWRDRISLRVELYGCDYVAESVNFNGKSYVSKDLSLYPVASYSDTIRFRLRTSHANGVILYSRGSQGDILALQLVDNRLLLHIDLGGEGIDSGSNVAVGSLLDDNLWHDVYINRQDKEIHFVVDRVAIREKIGGDMNKLDLNREFYIGGVPNFNQDGLVVNRNFTGCLENMYINHTNIFSDVKYDRSYKHAGEIQYSCTYERVESVTFNTRDAHIKIHGRIQRSMNISFDFRTFNEDGLLVYQKFSTEGFVKLFMEKGKLKLEIQGTDTPLVLLDPFDRTFNDGLWHKTNLVLATKDRIEIHVDNVPSITTRLFSMQTGDQYLLGGGHYGTTGFIGCMRYIYIEGRYVNILNLNPEQYTPNEVVFDSCQMVDRCNPNPCEHEGICKQNYREFFCDCSKTGYTGAVCHIPKHPLSCQAYRIDNPKERKAVILIDVDGSGPLEPFPVTCEFPHNNDAITILHHKNGRTTDVKGFNKAGSFIQDIVYDAGMDQIVELVNRSYSCSQNLRYDCFNARLFNSPVAEKAPFDPFSWWMSRNNQKMDYWGGSLPGSRKCNCGLYGTCKDPTKWCNCDSQGYGWLTDEGDITQREFLPVRQLRFGDTGSTMDEKKGRYTLGPLICEGDSLFDNVINFRYEDATIELPPFDMGHSGDIYFQFKTTAENGVFVHALGPTDFIKISLFGGDQIKFLYMAGNSPLGVNVETSYKLNDNNWHSVRVERNRKEAKVIVDGSLAGEVKEKAGPVRALHLTSKLIIGATIKYREGYVGCISSLILNGNLVDLYTQAQQGLYGVSPGCQGKCDSNPCLNNGTCLERYSGYDCDCQWTAFKGPICADEIGVNLGLDTYIRYDFEEEISTLEEYIHVSFITTEHTGMIFGMSSKSDEYLNLMMSSSGHLRLVFDFGFERYEIIIKNQKFDFGQNHDVIIKRSDKGAKMTIYVDNLEPMEKTFKIDQKADAQFNRLKSIYIGRNETMGTGEGFVGCISRVQFDDHFPLRRLFQENRRSNIRSFPPNATIREDTCGIEPIVYPEEHVESRPAPILPPGVFYGSRSSQVQESAILGSVLVIMLLALILMGVLISRYASRQKGEYRTHEDMGAKDAPDADTAIIHSKTGHEVPKKKEWFI